MCEQNSLASFEQLSTEIYFEIFDYLSYNDVVYAFSSLNQRFADVLVQYRRFLKAFTTPTRDVAFWQAILPTMSSQIEHLTITTIEFRLSSYLFPNLKSIVIDSPFVIDCGELVSLLKREQFKNVTSLKVRSEIVKDTEEYNMSVFQELVQTENSLYTFESLSEISLTYRIMHQLKMHTNLRSLALRVLDFRCLLSLLSYTPNLKCFNLLLSAYGLNDPPIPTTTLSNIKLTKCSIVIERGVINPRSFPLLSWFIRQFSSSLIELSLDLHQIKADKTLFTGVILQQQLLESMAQLKVLHLYIQLDATPANFECFLSTFQTSFWIDHQWTVAMHGTYLYTLPFHFDTFNNFIDFNCIKSSNADILNSRQAWSHVKSIEFAESFYFHSDLIGELKLKMVNLTSIILTSHTIHNLSTKMDQLNEINRTLDNITTVRCSFEWLQPTKVWLLRILPDFKYLMLSYNSPPNVLLPDQMLVCQEFDKYLSDEKMTTGHSYPFKIQHVEIKVILHTVKYVYQHVVELLKELLQMSDNLRTITFHFYHLPRFPSMLPYTDLDKTIELFNSGKLSEKYRIKHIQNYIQFVRTNDK